jgi:hypothetical protein
MERVDGWTSDVELFGDGEPKSRNPKQFAAQILFPYGSMLADGALFLQPSVYEIHYATLVKSICSDLLVRLSDGGRFQSVSATLENHLIDLH